MKKPVLKDILVTIIISIVLPLVAYNLLKMVTSNLTALSIATCIPLIDTMHHLIKHKKLDVFSSFMFVGFALTLIMALIGGNEKVLLLRESVVTGILGLIFLLSLFWKRPLIFYFALRFYVGENNQKRKEFKDNWIFPYFRFVMRMMTAVWGLLLAGEALIKIFLVYKVSVNTFLGLSSLLTYSCIGIGILWTIAYRKRSSKKLLDIKNKTLT